MSFRAGRGWRLLACTVVFLGACGCGAKTVKIHGKLTEGARPLKAAEHERIELRFCPYNGEGKEDGPPCIAEVDPNNGSYEAVVPAGRNRVCISYYQENLNDKFQGVFAPGQSPIIRDIQNASEIDLDLQKLQREAGPAAIPGTVSTAMPP